MSEIKKTKLYKELKKLDKSFANEVLKNSNEIIELINKKTTINFPNYTNHDIRHSIKIMETMYELIKDKTERLSSLEYALMIYAAMFHDIGMAVSDEEINKIKKNDSKYLYNQDFKLIKENLYNNEELAIQEVVRNAHGKIANDLINTKFKELFKLPQSSTYFSEELGMICQAHTEDKSYLEKISTYETKGDDEYNPRFVAILLRVADILDIDDTRTPIELYNTIELSNFSDGEWQKNFVIDNRKKIFSRNKLKEIRLQGTCEDIKVHRKLLNYIKWIENELIILVNETADMEEYYHIQINTQVQNKIKSKGYTIPDLKLNMDYHAVTNLLMGEAIYGSKDLGLRELLQNSIDAIMVKKDKLEIEKHPLKDSYEPTINIDIDEKNDKVIIRDNGMGMDEYIIKNYFLNVGKSYYKSKDFLNYNHHYNPIGNFGIGFLSCFMLSEKVQVITKIFNSNKKYTIDLEKDSEYIAFKEEEDNSNESGTIIILNLESFYNSIYKQPIDTIIKEHILIKNFHLNVDKYPIHNDNFTDYRDFENVDKYLIDNDNFTDYKELENVDKYPIHNDNFTDYRDFEKIDVEKFTNSLEGNIYIKKNTSTKDFYIKENYKLFYLNNNTIHKINDYSKIMKDIVLNNKILTIEVYQMESDNFIILLNKDITIENLDISINDEINNILYKIDDNTRFYSLKNKKFQTFSSILRKVNEFIHIDSYYSTSLNTLNCFSIYDNYDIYKEQKVIFPKLFLKNIALIDQEINIKHISCIYDYIIIDINIKIDLETTINRKKLTTYSKVIIENILSNIIYKYIKENWELTTEEKLKVEYFLNNINSIEKNLGY